MRERGQERIFAACAPGLEPALSRELAGLGLDARPVPGGAEADGLDATALACLGSRAADAVKVRLWEGPAGGIASARRDLARRLPGVELEARPDGERSTLSADAAGSPLFKRGWRARVGAAPLRESLAAGLLLELGFDGSRPLLDPMCGSGTIAIEAALLAARRAPGIGRSFAFEAWPGHDAARTSAVRDRLAALARTPPAPMLASDRNGGAVRLAGKNAEAAGVAPSSASSGPTRATSSPPPGPGFCLVNPPYGVRLDREVEESWKRARRRSLGAPRWLDRGRAGLRPGGRPPAPGDPARAIDVQNGGLRCRFLVYTP